jgi:hypothetical protein
MFAPTLLGVAGVVDAIRNGGDVEELATQAVANITGALLDQSYLNGLADFFDVLHDPVNKLVDYGTRQSSNLIPFSGAQRQFADALDPNAPVSEGPVEDIQSGIPFLSKQLPKKQNVFGEPVKRGLPTPLRLSGARQSQIDGELERLGIEVGFTGDTIDGATLNRTQQQQYQYEGGNRTWVALDTLINSAAYKKMSDEDKIRAIRSATTRAREKAQTYVE